jgi:hypothetical protein
MRLWVEWRDTIIGGTGTNLSETRLESKVKKEGKKDYLEGKIASMNMFGVCIY